MSERSALLACAVLVCGALACATPVPLAPPGGPPQAGSSCEGSWTTATTGVVIFPFAGTVSGRTAAGTVHPLEGASFHVVDGADPGRLPIATDAEGRFQGRVLLPTQGTYECRDGVIKTGYVIGNATISVRADGCSKSAVTVDAGWEPRPIELECKH